MTKREPVRPHSHCADTQGLENFFDETVSSATADTVSKTSIELSVPEAAKRLNTSERTIWRRIERGKLKSRTRGNKRLVKIPVLELKTSVDSDGHTTLNDPNTQANALVDVYGIFRDLQAANYRIGYLEAQVQNSAAENIKLLPDLQAKTAETERLGTRVHELEFELRNIKSTWWYRIWCWFLGR